ncbi:MAG: PD-(D/E)XK nuclease family protein, partial [Pseudomonadota bacterium]
VHHFESSADELRAAGAWARERLEHDADARLAIVVPNLSERAEAARRDVLDGLLPHAGFELTDPSAHWLNVSLGTSLSQVPAVADALHWIRFVVYGGSFDSVSRLNRCGSFPDDALTLERWLRLERDRDWNVASLAKAARSGRVRLPTWLAASRDLYEAISDREYPSTWVITIGERLRQSGWLATSVDDTIRYQLKTQWQESLESLARLDQACGRISLGETLELLDSVLVDRVFSPEQADAPVLLCGPIETTGLSFDAVWITGLDSVQWPPPGNPLSLVAVRLQREYEMPDASPEQTRAFWSTQWRRIRGASKSLVASYATFVDGRERLASPVIAGGRGTSRIESTDPTAITLLDCLPVKRTPEQFPVWPHGRRASGGHHVLARWAADPFAAQVIGRWNLRPLEQPTKGLSARTRGVLIHRSLETLYASGVSAILEDIDASVADAVASAFRREFVEAESAYRAALRYEERRARELLRAFVELESERTDLEIVALEAPLSLLLAGIDFQLRADRIDRLPTGDLIMDYKTGTRDADAAITRGDFDRITQLAVYALAADVAPAAVCLATLHPKHIGFRGIYADEVTRLPGDRSKPVNSLNTLIPLWRTEATRRAGALAAGQAWLNLVSPASEWLPYGVISRIADVRKHGE